MNKVSLIKKENELRLLIRNELEDITFNPENINKDEFKEKKIELIRLINHLRKLRRGK